MKPVNVDDVLKILHKYGKYIFVTDEKRYSSMVDEIANLKALKQEPCEDTVSRQAVLDEFHDLTNLYERIKQLPSVQPKQKTGRWILDEDKSLMFNIYKCSNCENIGARESKYCPNCGAKMVEPTCDNCKYNTASFMPCNACVNKSEYEPKEERQTRYDIEKVYDPIEGAERYTFVPKTGHWIDADGDNAICGCCNRLNHLYGTYCKHCGAKMESEESDG